MSRPTFIPPMAAQSVTELPEGPEWVYEVKFDGYRALLLKSGAGIELRSRNNKDLTNAYPSVLAAGRKLRADSLVLDGEVVALDASGRPSSSGAPASLCTPEARHRLLRVRPAAAGR